MPDCIVSDDGYVLHFFGVYGQQSGVFEQYDASGSYFIGNLLLGRQGSHLGIGFFFGNSRDSQPHTKQVPYFLVNDFFRDDTGLYRIEQCLTKISVVGHLYIKTSQCSFCGGVGASPVGNDDTLKSPFTA